MNQEVDIANLKTKTKNTNLSHKRDSTVWKINIVFMFLLKGTREDKIMHKCFTPYKHNRKYFCLLSIYI